MLITNYFKHSIDIIKKCYNFKWEHVLLFVQQGKIKSFEAMPPRLIAMLGSYNLETNYCYRSTLFVEICLDFLMKTTLCKKK